ncbi:MAG: hypothetical protein HZA27_00805 [Candidatus Omnitrophica bacterium]|nr:hypothetical protein [Candidatus Omnitrophota bacterium]
MEKLNLPIIKGNIPAAKWLSMDDYLKFVSLNLKYALDRKVIRKQKKSASVNVSFSLR